MVGSYMPLTGKHQAAGELSPAIERHAIAKGLDPDLVHAVIRAESAYRPDAVSPKGAIGLMQVMPATGRRFGVADLAQPEGNLRAGTAYLRQLLDRFDNVPLALAAYNAGEGAVIRHGNQIPPYPETQDYVRSILRDYGDVVRGATRSRVYAEGLHLAQDGLSEYRLVSSSFR
jgi:soluble lytic murein transglycosylase-like protein